MGTTATWALPYPELSDPPDGPTQIKALANRTDAIATQLKSGVPTLQMGQQNVVITSATTASLGVTFPRAFTALPTVVGNINAASANMVGWTLRMTAVSNSAANILLTTTGAGVTYTPAVQWLAALNPVTPLAMKAETFAVEEGWHYATATCHTPGCPKEDEAVSGILVPDVPADWGWGGISCGVCGQPITDVVAT